MTNSPGSEHLARRARLSRVVLSGVCVTAAVALVATSIHRPARAADNAAPAAAAAAAGAAAAPAGGAGGQAKVAAANLPPADPNFDKVAGTPPTGDHVMWGGTPFRNMVSGEKNPPTEWDVQTGKNIKWSQVLGSKSYAGPTVADGKVYVGTNNAAKRDPKYVTPEGNEIDGGVLMCFDEKDGHLPGEGLCSTPYAEKDRIWYCSNRCEVICLDVSASEPREVWKLDMMKELGVFPHNMTASAPVAYGDYIYVETGNGVDDTHKNVVAPQAPGIVCVNKNTGKVVWTNNSAGPNVLHGQWSSAAIAVVKGRPLVIAPLGDAWVYAFDARDGTIVWKFDTNPKDSLYIPGGDGGRNEVIATPVIFNNRMYIANGQDPEHGTGRAHLWCVDITKAGDVSPELPADPNAAKPKPGDELVGNAAAVAASRKGKPNPNSGVIWEFGPGEKGTPETDRMHRTISSVAVADGLCFAADFSGFLHCLDANTGKQYWGEDLESYVWGSPYLCDGKVYIGNEDGDVRIFAASKEKKAIASHNMGMAVYGTPVMSHGTMYILGLNRLFAIQNGTSSPPPGADEANK
jgi:outer membrane protein assembly factor BamB